MSRINSLIHTATRAEAERICAVLAAEGMGDVAAFAVYDHPTPHLGPNEQYSVYARWREDLPEADQQRYLDYLNPFAAGALAMLRLTIP